MGAPITINSAGSVRTSRTQKATLSTSAKTACIVGSTGAIVAPAITVSMLVASSVPLSTRPSAVCAGRNVATWLVFSIMVLLVKRKT
jgi:hypothetical protein